MFDNIMVLQRVLVVYIVNIYIICKVSKVMHILLLIYSVTRVYVVNLFVSMLSRAVAKR